MIMPIRVRVSCRMVFFFFGLVLFGNIFILLFDFYFWVILFCFLCLFNFIFLFFCFSFFFYWVVVSIEVTRVNEGCFVILCRAVSASISRPIVQVNDKTYKISLTNR